MRFRFITASLGASALCVAFGSLACQSAEAPRDLEGPTEEPVLYEPETRAAIAEDADAAADAVLAEAAARLAAPAAPAAAPASAPQDLATDAARMQRIRERQAFLAGEYIKQGDAALDSGDLEGALRQYAQALEVSPTNEEAKNRIGRVEALMGKRFQVAADFFQDAASRETVRRAQARIAAEQAALEGDTALRGGDYAAAVENYREAQVILSYHPLIATDSLDERIVTGKLNDALEMLAESQRDEAARLAAAAAAERERKELEARNYRENKLRTLYEEANAAFLSDDYAKAEALANQILLEDPGNRAAIAMRDTAQSARHAKVEERTRRDYREQWQRTFEELDTMDVPQTDSLVFDDLRRWADVSQRQPLEFSSADPQGSIDKAAVLARLEATPIKPKFVGPDGEGSPIAEIATYLQNVTGVNFLVSNLVLEDLAEEETTIKLDLPERSVRKVLDIIAETSESLRWKVQDGVVMFVTREEMLGGQQLRMYEVRDIIHPVPNFAGREINISPSGGLEQPEEDFEEREGLVVTSDALEGLIRDNIAPDSWNEDPANSVRITESGTMVVNQTPEVHDLIQDLLDDLREATGIMVDIQARFLSVEDNFLEDIGVDFRGLGQPGLGTNTFLNDFGDPSTQAELGAEIGNGTDLGAFYDEGGDGDIRGRTENLYDLALGDTDVITGAGGLSFQWTYLNDLQMEMILRAVSKSERVELVTAPRLLVFNTARANIAVMNQVAYVQDFDVEIAQAASIADPIVNVVQDGVVLDVRPVVSADRRFIMMELRPTVALLRRPIEEFETSIGSTQGVTIQLPELDIQRVRTTVPLPDGGTVMLGGLKVSEKQDFRSGVPILNKIPVLRFAFERKGNYVSNRKLLILIKANIVIPQEHEPSPSQLGM